MPNEQHDEKRYILVIKNRYMAFGPFSTLDDAEYAAMDYYGTAVTGASAKDAFLIADRRAAARLRAGTRGPRAHRIRSSNGERHRRCSRTEC